MTWKKAFALLLVIAILGAGVYYMREMEQDDSRNLKELYSEVEPLQRQREALAAERDSLEVDYALQMRDVGTIQLLFKELSEDIYTEVYPLMRDRGIVGVLGVTSKEYPGLQKKLKIDQFNRLLMDGWGSCLIYEKNTNFSKWYDGIADRMERDELPMPTAIFFPEGNYTEAMTQDLIDHGITTVVLPGEDGRSATVTPLDGEVWVTSAMPWNYTGVNTDTELLARTNGANLTFTISFKNLWDAYEEESFIRILDNWESMLDTDDPLEELSQGTNTASANPAEVITAQDQLLMPRLKTTNYESARQAHLAAVSDNEGLQREQDERRAALDEQIAALDEQIRAVYDRWEQSAKKVK